MKQTLRSRIVHWIDLAFNVSMLKKSRLHWVDYLRGIAIILVVYRHVLLGIQASGMTLPPVYLDANIMFFSFRMPLFFILSGIFIGGSLAKKSLGQLVAIKFENLLYPYFIWAFLEITLQLFAGHWTNNSSRSLIDYTYILWQPRELDQFWYLPALFNSTVIYLLVKVKLKAKGWTQILLGLLLYFLSGYCRPISMMSDWMEFYIFFALGDIISEFFFRPQVQKFLKNGYALLGILPVFIVTQVIYLYLYHGTSDGQINPFYFLVISLTGCLTMFMIAFRLQDWNILGFLRVLGFHSLYIYVMHVMVSALARGIFVRIFGVHNPVLLLFLVITVAVTIPVIVYNLFIFKKPLWFLFSFHRPKKKSGSQGTQPQAQSLVTPGQ